MNYINTTTLRNNLASTINEVAEDKKFMLIGNRNTVKTVLVDVDLFEDLLEANNKEYLASIKKARKEMEKGEYYTFEQIFGKL